MITPSQIREKKITVVDGGGYDRAEVNELLLDVIESYEAVYAENKELYRKMEILANRIEEYRADEDTIKSALIAAQKTANKLLDDTKQKASAALEESAQTAQKTVVDAKEKADKIISSARDYVANLTSEKEQAAAQIVDGAEKKANDAVSGAKVIAQNVLNEAKELSKQLLNSARAEKENEKKAVEKLKEETNAFKSGLISLYESQLETIKNISDGAELDNADETQSKLEGEIEKLYSAIDELSKSNIDDVIEKADDSASKAVSDKESGEAVVEENTDADEEPKADLPQSEDEEASDAATSQPSGDETQEDEVDEIIEEIESLDKTELELTEEEPGEENEQISQEETKAALDAFSSDEITPISGDAQSIPEISDEPELEDTPQPFENYFHVNKEDPHNTDEVISLIPEDDDEDDDSDRKFKGFFKKKK